MRIVTRTSVASPSWHAEIFIALWWAIYLYSYSSLNAGDMTSALTAIETGSILVQALVLSLGFYGSCELMRKKRISRLLACTWFRWLLAYIVWSGVTIFWSQSPQLSIRRYCAFLAVVSGSVGLALGLFEQHATPIYRMAQATAIAGTSAAVTLLVRMSKDLTVANILNPAWSPEIRARGPFLLNAVDLGLLAASLLWMETRRTIYLVAIALQTIAVLAMKSRSQTAFTLIVMLLAWIITLTRKNHSITFVVVFLLVIPVAYVGHLYDLDAIFIDSLMPYLQRGENSTTFETLNGRVPLWNLLLQWMAMNPLSGVGFGAFWTGEQMVSVMNNVGWKATVAHNGFLDEALATGIPGLLFLCGFLGASLRDIWRQGGTQSCFSYGQVFGICVIILYVLFNLTDSIMQFYFRVPFLCILLCTTCLTMAPRRITGTLYSMNGVTLFVSDAIQEETGKAQHY